MFLDPNHLLFMIYYYCCSNNKTTLRRRPYYNSDTEETEDLNDDFVFLYHALTYKKGKVFVHSRYCKVFYKSLSLANRRLRQQCIPRIALHDPSDSSWRKLYHSKNDQALIILTGLDYVTFEWLHKRFEVLYTISILHTQLMELSRLLRPKGDSHD